jgi:hypothetical protein
VLEERVVLEGQPALPLGLLQGLEVLVVEQELGPDVSSLETVLGLLLEEQVPGQQPRQGLGQPLVGELEGNGAQGVPAGPQPQQAGLGEGQVALQRVRETGLLGQGPHVLEVDLQTRALGLKRAANLKPVFVVEQAGQKPPTDSSHQSHALGHTFGAEGHDADQLEGLAASKDEFEVELAAVLG